MKVKNRLNFITGKAIIFIIIFLQINLFSQNIETARKQYINSISDSSKVFSLIHLADEFRQINPDSSKYYAELSYQIAQGSGKNSLVAYANVARANAYSYKLEFAESLLAANEALEYFYSINDEYGKMKSYAAIGVAYGVKGDYSKAISYNLYSLKIADVLDEYKQKATLMNNMSSIYMLNQEYDKALELLSNVIKMQYDSIPLIKATAMVNTGIINAIKGNYNEAEAYYNLVEQIAIRENNMYLLQISYVNKAHLYRFLNKIEDAMYNYKLALDYQMQLGQHKPMAASLKGIGDIYRDQNNFILAKIYYAKSDSVANTYNLIEEKANVLLSFATLYELENNYKYALDNLKKYYHIKDSIGNINVRKQIAAIEAEFELDKKQTEIELLKITEIANAREIKRQKFIIFLLVLGSILFLTLFAFFLVQKRKKDIAYRQLLAMNLDSMQKEEQNSIRNKKKISPQELVLSDIIDSDFNNTDDVSSEEPDNNIVKNKYQKSGLTEEQKEVLILALHQLFEEERVYLDSNLSIDMVADKLNVYKKYISQVINEKFGMNFTSFINEYRIKEARKMLISEEYANYSIEGIATSCGFNSRTTFNTAFNKFTGITPSFFRENAVKKTR